MFFKKIIKFIFINKIFKKTNNIYFIFISHILIIFLVVSCNDISITRFNKLLDTIGKIKPTDEFSCPDGYILINSNSSLGISRDFCVAKYEMKNQSNIAVSIPDGDPWININAYDSWNSCLELNSEASTEDKLYDLNSDGTYSLISNLEWMVISRNIEEESSNWYEGTLNRGWAASETMGDSYTHSAVAPHTGVDCLYSSGENTCASTGLHAHKRTHRLLNSEEIWDFSGNVYEWVDWNSIDNSFTLGPLCEQSWGELNLANCSELSPNTYMPLDITLNSVQNIGLLLGSANNGAVVRSGYWNHGKRAGVYLLVLNHGPTTANRGIGFRCVYRP